MDNEPDFVNVAIRIKPVSNEEQECLKVVSKEPPVLLLTDRSQTFTFDNIFTEEISQELIYNQSVKPFVEHVKQGYNCTVFAYGQTGTGKTYTMGTDLNVKNEEEFGLIPRALNNFFEYDNDDHREIEIKLSFIEIYNKGVFDLLKKDNQKLQVKGLKAQGRQEKVFSLFEAKRFLEMGNNNRHTAGTKQNLQSSRSHAIFTIYCNVKHKDKITSAKLHLVDLAGCENVKKTGTEGNTFQEGIEINQGLLCIGQVMSALSNNSSFIPYRQSLITNILQDSLNKQNFISLIACVSPLAEDSTGTLQSLEFAQRVKRFKSKPEVNEVISQYKKEHPALFLTVPFKNTPFKNTPFKNTCSKNTPFKRPLLMQTPRIAKKIKTLPSISDSVLSNNTTDRSNSLASCASTSSASCASTSSQSTVEPDLGQQALSPLIKKYMSFVEASLQDKIEDHMNKIESVLLKSVMKPKLLTMTDSNESTNFKTPSVQWNELKHEVSKMVRTEIAQMKSDKIAIATSSPIDTSFNVRKALNYDESPLNDQNNSDNKENNFKVPLIPALKKKLKPKNSMALSPIENISPAPRRSVRLSIQRINQSLANVSDFDVSIQQKTLTNNLSSRQSVRRNASNTSFAFSPLQNKTLQPRRSDRQSIQREKQNMTGIERFEPTVLRDRRTIKPKNLSIANTPAGKRLIRETQKGTVDSPCTAHTKNVLKVINTGNMKEVQKLQTIGVKTAEQIRLFREIKGKLKNISDLKELPGWGSKKLQKFMQHNLLKEELVFK